MTEEQIRAEFEEWAKSGKYDVTRSTLGTPNDPYERLETTFAYRAWIAATSSTEERVKKLREAVARIAAIENKTYGGDWEEIEEAREVARKALEETQ